MIDADSPAMMSFVDKDAPSTVIGDDGSYLLAGLPPGEYRVLPRTGDSSRGVESRTGTEKASR